MGKIGLIAGNGEFPLYFADKLKLKSFAIYTIAYLEEANPLINNFSEETKWIHPGEVNKLIKFFKKNKVKDLVMLGAIKKTKLFKNIKPDIKALSIITKIKTTHDDTVIRALANYLEKTGFKIKSPSFFLPEIIAQKGIWTKRKPTYSEQNDIEIGLFVAKEIGRIDIGQSVVVGQGSVLAIETVDGTDATIKRGGLLCNKKAVLVKICKPNQDVRFDTPAIGTQTIDNMYKYNISTIAIKSKTTLVLDKFNIIKKANKYDISIICL